MILLQVHSQSLETTLFAASTRQVVTTNIRNFAGSVLHHDVGCGGGREILGFRRNLLQAFLESQTPGTIRISQGMTATMTVIKVATLSPKTEPDSRKASQICAKAPALPHGLSTLNETSTATFSVSLAKTFRSAVWLSNCD